MKIIRLEDCPARTVTMEGAQGAIKQVPIGRADGAPTFSVRVFTLESGGHTPHHAHEAEHVNYVLEGEGEILTDAGPRRIAQGDYVLIPPQERHQYRNNSSVRLVFLCMVPKDYE